MPKFDLKFAEQLIDEYEEDTQMNHPGYQSEDYYDLDDDYEYVCDPIYYDLDHDYDYEYDPIN